MSRLGLVKHTIRTIIIIVIVSYFGLITLLSIPTIQRKTTDIVEKELTELLQTNVRIGNIDLGLLNRIIIQNVYLSDQKGNDMLKIARLSAKFEIKSFFYGKISISSVQLFGMNALLSKETPESPANFQFVIDAFSTDNKKKEFNLNLRINSLLIKRGTIRYDLLSAEETPDKFNQNHIGVENLSATLSLKALNKDSLNTQVKKMSFKEKCGFELKRLSSKITANKNGFTLSDFNISLKNTELAIDTFNIFNPSQLQLAQFDKDTKYMGDVSGSIILSDIAPFIPKLKNFDENINLNIVASGKGKEISIKSLDIFNNSRDIVLKGKAHINANKDMKRPYINGEVSQSHISNDGLRIIIQNLSGSEDIPDIVNGLGFADFKGQVKGRTNKITTKGILKTSPGVIVANVTMNKDSVTLLRSYSGNVSTEGFDLGELTNRKDMLGKTIFNINFNGFKYNNNKPQSYVKGIISEFEYKNYTYNNILLDGEYKPGGFKGQLSLNDKNGTILVNGQFNTKGKTPDFNLTTRIKDFNPHALKLTDKYEGNVISMNLKADFSGHSIDDMKGEIRIDSLNVDAIDHNMDYKMDLFSVKAGTIDNEKRIVITSPFLNGKIEGDYSYQTILASITNIINHYTPSFLPNRKPHKATDNNFRFNLKMENSDLFSKVMGIPLVLNMPASIRGYFSDKDSTLYINGNFPQLTYNDKLYESASVVVENPGDKLSCKARLNTLMSKGAMLNLAFESSAKNDSINSTIYWGNNTNVTYSGKVNALAHFRRTPEQKMLSQIDIMPSQIILNDTIWKVHRTSVFVEKDSIDIHNFLFEHADQHIRMNGKIGKDDQHTCFVDLKNINLQYIMNMIQFHAVEFNGNASGTVYLKHLMNRPQIDALLDVEKFSLNNALLGRANIKGGFNNEDGAITLDADIHENDSIYTKVKGYVSLKKKGLDLDIDAGGTNMAFLEHFIDNIFSDLKGRAYGNVRLYGPFKQLDLEGKAKANLGMKVNILNNRFELATDSVLIESGLFRFINVKMTDTEGNTGLANGELIHHKLGNLRYRFKFDTNSLLVYNTSSETPDFPFYGKLYASGNIVLRGGNGALNVDGTLRADNKTSFAYVLGTASAATDNQFIKFVDKTPRRIQADVNPELYHYLNRPKTTPDDDSPLDVRINFEIEPTEQATMKVIMDPTAGDNITAKGTGNLRINFYNKGDFQMFGNYNISEGIYKMSMQNIIRKDFVLQPGGTVSFNGNPKNANLNLQAVYTVNSASLNDLIPDASNSKGNVRVNCLLNLTGNMTSPTLKFDLDLPTVSDEDKELVRSLTSTEDQMNTQIIYLLGIGKFYPFNYAENANQSDATSSLAFSTLSGQLNNMLSQVIDSQNWNIGTNLTTGEKGWSDVEAEAILSGRLLNNRLIINGNFGYRENTMRNTNFVGDFEAIWLLTKNGELRLRGYNQTNDRYFTKSTLTTQGVGLMYKKDFSYWKELLNWMFRKKK